MMLCVGLALLAGCEPAAGAPLRGAVSTSSISSSCASGSVCATLLVDHAAGRTTLATPDDTLFRVGDTVEIRDLDTGISESRVVAGVGPVQLQDPLTNSYGAGHSSVTVMSAVARRTEASNSDDLLDSGKMIGAIIAVALAVALVLLVGCAVMFACRASGKKREVPEEKKAEEGIVEPPPAVVNDENVEFPVSAGVAPMEEGSAQGASASSPPLATSAPPMVTMYEWKGHNVSGKKAGDIQVHWRNNVTMHAVEPPTMEADEDCASGSSKSWAEEGEVAEAKVK